MLSGGITFYESPVAMRDCRITDSFGEDALNIIRTEFEIRFCEFGDSASDALDGDYVSGSVIGSSFHDIVGDALDFSGSVVELSTVSISRVGDKGISAGEASNVTVQDMYIEDTSIAIASKDLSSVSGERVTIVRATLTGLAAYQKKSEYGPGNMSLGSVEFAETDTNMLIDLDSWANVNESLLKGTDADVDVLYDLGILGN